MKTSSGLLSKTLSLLGVALITFGAATAVILLIVYAGEASRPPLVMIMAGSALMAGILVPTSYGLVLRPMARDFELRLKDSGMVDANRSAVTDSVTRLANRRGITSSLLEAMAQAERYGDPLSVAMAEVGDFKRLTESHGRKGSDQVLQTVSAVLGETLRMPDRAGRYGDKEFLIILPHTSIKDATKITERIRRGVTGAAPVFGGKEVKISVTLGATQFHKGEDLEQLLTRVAQAVGDAGKPASGRSSGKKSA
ncbi:MAG: GGDEF domain-containing protein [Acidiferrobacterales bacterium]